MEYLQLRSSAKQLNIDNENSPCKRGRAMCCTVDAPLTPADWDYIQAAIDSGDIPRFTVEQAIKNAQNPMRVSCPWLTNKNDCSIYKWNPLLCSPWGISGLPDVESPEVIIAAAKMESEQTDQNISRKCIQSFTCPSCQPEIANPERKFSLAKSLLSKLAYEYVMSFRDDGLTTTRGAILINLDRLKD